MRTTFFFLALLGCFGSVRGATALKVTFALHTADASASEMLFVTNAPTPAPASAVAGTTDTWGVIWHEVRGNPRLAGVRALSWRAAGCTDPALVRAPDGTLTVWFTTMGIKRDKDGKFAADGPWIGRATGADAPSPVLKIVPDEPVIRLGAEGSWDRYIETVCVLRDEQADGYQAWFLGYRERGGATGFVAPAIGQMHSADKAGTRWERAVAPIYRPQPHGWDGLFISGPTVVRGPDKLWRLYYSGMGMVDGKGTGGIGLLTSADGVSWTAHGDAPVMGVEPGIWDSQVLEQTVIYARGRYWLWYSGLDSPLSPQTTIAIGLATSEDGVHWRRHSKNPVLKPGAKGSWNDARVLAPDVIVEPDGSLLMSAYGQSKQDIKNNATAGSIGFWRSGS
ncbi:MAG: hypothetical protein ACLQM8_20655 [Limisphaerales bacterium]